MLPGHFPTLSHHTFCMYLSISKHFILVWCIFLPHGFLPSFLHMHFKVIIQLFSLIESSIGYLILPPLANPWVSLFLENLAANNCFFLAEDARSCVKPECPKCWLSELLTKNKNTHKNTTCQQIQKMCYIPSLRPRKVKLANIAKVCRY